MTPQPHCEHECVCGDYAIVMFDESEEKQACCAIRKCEHDTRSRPAPAANDRGWDQGFQDGQASAIYDMNVRDATIRQQERERVLDEAVKLLWQIPFYGEGCDKKNTIEMLESLRNAPTAQERDTP